MSRAVALMTALRIGEPAVPPVTAPPSEPALRWEAPASCPTTDEVAAAIDARVPVGSVRVHARVDEAPAGFVADVAIDSAHGSTQRRLESPSCTTVVDAIVLLAHVAAEPLPTHERIAPPPAVPLELPEPSINPTAPDVVATPDVVLPPEQPTLEYRFQRPRVRATIGASAIIGGGTLPRIDAGVLGTVGIAHRIGRAELGALYLAPMRASLGVEADARVVVDAWGLALRVCPAIPLPTTRVELSICAAATAGRLRGTSSGTALQEPGTAQQPWVRLAAGPELAIAVHPRVRLVAAVEGGGHIVRPGFVIAGLDRVWAPQRWAVHGLAGVQVRLP